MSEEFEVTGHHEHHIEHEAEHGVALSQQVAMFTAVLATLGAIVSYLGGHTQNTALYYKNEAVLDRTLASDQWSEYQAESMKKHMAEAQLDATTDPAKAIKIKANMDDYEARKQAIKQTAQGYEEKSQEANQEAEHALHPHEKLALAMTLIQIAISAASITALTKRRWLFALAGASALGGVGVWIWAYLL
jgi:Domain of unknown function (DUF4337)